LRAPKLIDNAPSLDSSALLLGAPTGRCVYQSECFNESDPNKVGPISRVHGIDRGFDSYKADRLSNLVPIGPAIRTLSAG
jgi:hypothetical protein